MSGDLKLQVRDYTEFFMGTVESIDLEEVKERPFHLTEGPARPLVSPRRRRGWLVAVAGVVAVLVFGLLALLTRGTASEAPVLAQPSPSPTVTTPAPVPPVEAGESLSDWSRIPHDADVFGDARIASVVVGGPGLVAVGSSPSNHDDPGVDGVAAVWTSTDGIAWSRVPHDEAVFGGEGDQGMDSVIVGGPGLLAFGTDEGRVRRGALWASVDGLNWTRLPQDVVPDRDVVAGGPGFVSVGEAAWRAVVMTSADGLNWTRVPHDEAVFGLILGDGNAMTGVTMGGPGFVAVGSDGLNSDNPTGRARAVVWTSVDGLSWSRVPHDEAVFGGEGDQGMFDVTVGGPGLVAVGEDEQGAPVWTSTDGIKWIRIPPNEAVFPRSTGIFRVFAGGPGLVAFGEAQWGVPAVWTSVDGTSWRRAPDDEAVFKNASVDDLIAVGSRLVAVGSDGGDAAVWVYSEASEN